MPPTKKRARPAPKMTPSKKAASARAKTTSSQIFRSLPLSRNVGSYRTGFPKQMFMRHKYMQNFIPVTTGNVGLFQISCNGLFDPDNAGATTHQPMYFDQVSGLYNKYVVLASKATFTFNSTGTTGHVLCGVYIEDDTTATPSTAVGCAEQASAQFRIIPAAPTSETFQQTNQISVKWDAKKAFGGDVIDNPNLVAATTANPTEQQYYTFFSGATTDPSTPVATLTVNVIAEYNVQWFELKNVGES